MNYDFSTHSNQQLKDDLNRSTDNCEILIPEAKGSPNTLTKFILSMSHL